MNFANPWMLAGAAAVGIPIALHFFYKARYRKLPWAAMEFLKEAIEQTSRRLKFQEWILLALRCLAILLLALAIARPGMQAGSAGRGDSVDAVIIIDTSYSMGAKDGEQSRIEIARNAARGVIDSLPANSTVQIIGCADRAELLGPKTRSNLDQARQLIDTIAVSGLSSDLMPGLHAALEAANSGTAPVKEIYVIGDLQKLAFERQQGSLRDKCDEIRKQVEPPVNLVFLRCGKEDRKIANIAVMDIQTVGTIPHTRSRVPFVVTLKNTGKEAVKSVKVGLTLDDKAIERDEIQVDQIAAGDLVTVTLTGSLEDSGPRVLTARLTGDNLPGDNRLDRVILVRDVIRVLLVDGTPNPAMPAESAAHFVRNALTPVPAERTEEYYIRPQVAPVAELSAASLQSMDVVYLLNAPAQNLPPEFVKRLQEFVTGGGGLVIGCGDNVNAADYNRVLGSGGAKLLPYDLTEVRNATETAPFRPAPESVAHPSFLSEFVLKSDYSAPLGRISMTKIFGVKEDGADAAASRVLIRTADSKPFVASRVVGDGETVFVSTSLDERWTNFPGRGSDAFVPFNSFTVAHLTSRKAQGGTRTAGEPLVWNPPDAETGFELVKPPKAGESSPRRVRLDRPEAKPGEKLAVTATDTADPGIYRIVPDGVPDSKGALFAVNADLRESQNLDMASDADLAKLLGFQPVVRQAGTNTEAAVNQLRLRSELTEVVLLLLLAALVAESAWAWVCGRAW